MSTTAKAAKHSLKHSAFFAFKSQPALIRTEKLNGKTYTVVPVIAMVEGVRQAANSPVPELVVAAEFKKTLADWEGKPATIHHPRKGGMLTFAKNDGADTIEIGFMSKPVLNAKRLKMEAWVDDVALDLLVTNGNADAKTLRDKFNAEETVEISAGYFAKSEPMLGVFEDKPFFSVQRGIDPDHLAFLPGKKGACSIEAGCGAPRVNVSVEGAVFKAHCDDETCACANETPNEVETSGTLLTEAITVYGGEFVRDNSKTLSDSDIRSAIQSALAMEREQELASGGDWYSTPYIVAIFESGNGGTVILDYYPWVVSRQFKLSSKGAITLEPDEKRVRPVTTFVDLVVTAPSVFEDKQNKSLQASGEKAQNSTQQAQSANNGDNGENNMKTREQRIDEILTVNGCPWEESDRDTLMKMNEGTFEKALKIVPPHKPLVSAHKGEEASQPGTASPAAAATSITAETVTETAKKVADDAIKAHASKPQTAAEYLANTALPPEIREVLNEGFNYRTVRREKMIDAILGHEANTFEKAELEAMSTPTLEKFTTIALASSGARTAQDILDAATRREGDPVKLNAGNGNGEGEKVPASNTVKEPVRETAHLRVAPRSNAQADDGYAPPMPLCFELDQSGRLKEEKAA